jgi:hypothetical protein
MSATDDDTRRTRRGRKWANERGGGGPPPSRRTVVVVVVVVVRIVVVLLLLSRRDGGGKVGSVPVHDSSSAPRPPTFQPGRKKPLRKPRGVTILRAVEGDWRDTPRRGVHTNAKKRERSFF